MFVGVCRLVLSASHSHSLKERRSVVRRVKDRVRARFDVTMAEVGGQDTWQRIVLGFAVVGSDSRWVAATVRKVVDFVDGLGLASVDADEHEVIEYGDEPMAGGGDDRWAPAEWVDEAEEGPAEPATGGGEPPEEEPGG
jgi:hypothetical protein